MFQLKYCFQGDWVNSLFEGEELSHVISKVTDTKGNLDGLITNNCAQ